MSDHRKLIEVLSQHLDLIPEERRPLAIWLTTEWDHSSRFPSQIRSRFWQRVTYDLNAPDAPENVLRDLALELLAKNKQLVARRNRVGSSKDIPLGPRGIE